MISGDIPTFTGGTWWIAEPDTPPPATDADADGFTDAWPDGWTRISANPRRHVTLEMNGGVYYLISTRPLRHLRYNRGMMLGWQCECRCERLVVNWAVKVTPNRYRLRRLAPGDRSFLISTVTAADSCAWQRGE